ncbi:hypothetical protein L195_g062834, partial [Trifolium pratense]
RVWLGNSDGVGSVVTVDGSEEGEEVVYDV